MISRERASTLILLIAIFLMMNVIGAIMITVTDPRLDYFNSFYLTMTMSSTVGFGNVAPETDAAKAVVTFYQFVPIGMFLAWITILALPE